MVTRTLTGARLPPGASLLISTLGAPGCAPGCPLPLAVSVNVASFMAALPPPWALSPLAEDSVYFHTLRPLVCLFLSLPPTPPPKMQVPEDQNLSGQLTSVSAASHCRQPEAAC